MCCFIQISFTNHFNQSENYEECENEVPLPRDTYSSLKALISDTYFFKHYKTRLIPASKSVSRPFTHAKFFIFMFRIMKLGKQYVIAHVNWIWLKKAKVLDPVGK